MAANRINAAVEDGLVFSPADVWIQPTFVDELSTMVILDLRLFSTVNDVCTQQMLALRRRLDPAR